MGEETSKPVERGGMNRFDKLFLYLGFAAIIISPIIGLGRIIAVILGFSMIPTDKNIGLMLIAGGIFTPYSLLIPPAYFIQEWTRKNVKN